MLTYPFFAHGIKNQNLPLMWRVGRYIILLTFLTGMFASGCGPIDKPQLPPEVPPLVVSTPFALTPTNQAVATIIPTLAPTRQSFEKDSQWIAFTSFQDSYLAVYTIDIGNGSVSHLTPNNIRAFSPQWSPDGRAVGFLSGNEDNDKQLLMLDVEKNSLSGPEISHITNFSWSPNGQFIVFASNKLTSENRYRTYLTSVADLQTQVLYESDVAVFDIQWSPTTDQILNLALLEQAQLKFVYILDLMGKAKELPLKGSPGYIDWDPTGQQIAYDNMFFPAFNQKEIRVISIDGANDHPLTELERFSHDPQWSPDGKMVAYQSYEVDTNPAINLLNLENNENIQISPDGLSSWYPSWSPNGQQVAYLVETSNVNEKGYSLFVFYLSTGEIRELVTDFVSPYRPVWRP